VPDFLDDVEVVLLAPRQRHDEVQGLLRRNLARQRPLVGIHHRLDHGWAGVGKRLAQHRLSLRRVVEAEPGRTADLA
jgi:hypothetical protein